MLECCFSLLATSQSYLIEPDKKGIDLDKMRERAHLRMRTEKGRAVVKTRDQVAKLFRRYFEVRSALADFSHAY